MTNQESHWQNWVRAEKLWFIIFISMMSTFSFATIKLTFYLVERKGPFITQNQTFIEKQHISSNYTAKKEL